MGFPKHRKTSAIDTGYFGTMAILDCEAGDNIKIMFMNTTDNDDPTFISSTLIMERMH